MSVPTYYRLAGSSGSGSTTRALKGPLRMMPGGYIGDDTGYRRILLGSDFPYFVLWKIDNAEARRGKQALARCGYQGSRDFVLIAEDNDDPTPPGTYWYGRSISKSTFRETAAEALDYSASLGLRTVLTAGHRYQNDADELNWFDEWTQIVRDQQAAIAWIETLGNEVSTNRPELAANIDVAMAHAAQLHAIIRRNLPGTLVTNGDFGNESDVQNPQYPHEPTLTNSAAGADMMDIHNQRQVDFVKHSHTMWLSTHYYGSKRIPLVEGEVGGENDPYPLFQQGGDVYAPCNDPHLLLAEVGIQQMTGQATIYLNGPGVRRYYPLDSTLYFPKLANACEVIPEDIATWRDGNNPSWFIKDKAFVYVGLAAYGQTQHPPQEVATATFYGMDGPEGDASGWSLEPPKGWTGGIVCGTFV